MALSREDQNKIAKRIINTLIEVGQTNPEVTMMDFVEVLDLVKKHIVSNEVKEQLLRSNWKPE